MKWSGKKAAFSLIEVLVSIVIAVIIFAALSKGLVGGSFLLKQVENKSRAAGIAAAKMEEYLAKSYSSLDVGTYQGTKDLGVKPVFDWDVEVSKEWIGDDPSTVDNEGIPYKRISVTNSYNETDYKSVSHRKTIQLLNLVPYPYIHTDIKSSTVSKDVPASVYSQIIEIPVRYEVDKDLMVIYNIAIHVSDASGITPTSTIYTKCKVDGLSQDIETRTPIITQPLISNVVGVNNVKKGDHKVTVEWYKDVDSGKVMLKEINVIVVAFEHKSP